MYKPIKTEKQYKECINKFTALADILEKYEDEHYPIDEPSQSAIAEFMNEHQPLTLQYCIECHKPTEHNGDFCTKCGSSYTTRDLLDIIEKQDSIIAEQSNALQTSSFIISTITLPPHYFTNVHLKN